MSNAISLLDLILPSQAQKEVTSNNLSNAFSPSALWARRESQSGGLVWGFYGGVFWSGSPVVVPSGSLTLPPSSTVFIEANATTGQVSQNTVGFTPGAIPLYEVITGPSLATDWSDKRCATPLVHLSSVHAAGGPSVTLNGAQASSQILEFTGALTSNVEVIFPARPFKYSLANLTSGAFTLTCKVAGQPGVAVGQGKRCEAYCNGTDIVRSSADV